MQYRHLRVCFLAPIKIHKDIDSFADPIDKELPFLAADSFDKFLKFGPLLYRVFLIFPFDLARNGVDVRKYLRTIPTVILYCSIAVPCDSSGKGLVNHFAGHFWRPITLLVFALISG